MKKFLLIVKIIIIAILTIPVFIASVLVSIIALLVIFGSGMIWISDATIKFIDKRFDQ